MNDVNNAGVALIPALLTVAVVSVVASGLSWSQWLWMRRVENVRDRLQADLCNLSAIRWAAARLVGEKEDGDLDQRARRWTGEFPLEIPGAQTTLRLRDAQARFNLNSLLRGGGRSAADARVFARLTQAAGVPAALTEAAFSMLQERGSLKSPEELREIGADEEAMRRLRPLLIALPRPTEVNVNTAEPRLLAALFAGTSEQRLAQLLAARSREPFSNKAQFIMRAGRAPESEGVYGVRTDFFLIEAQTRLNRALRRSMGLAERSAEAKGAKIHWVVHGSH